MADDGMLVNFSLASDTIAPQTKFKGGSWKDRFLVKKAAKHRAQRGVPADIVPSRNRAALLPASSSQIIHNDDWVNERPLKRRKENGNFTAAARHNVTHSPENQGRHHQSKVPREVVSSLFSYNPKSSNPVERPADAPAVAATPTNAPLPDGIDTFTSLGLSAPVAAHLLTKMALKTPTAIQKSSVSQLIKEDTDAFIQSETGSGKTLAYLLPIVQRIMTLTGTGGTKDVHRDSGLFAIILAPTRELCKQILVVLERLLGCAHWIVAGNVIGGEKKKSEKARLRKGLNILVATPGRLVDHLENTKVLDVSSVRWLVLDEGDRLTDLGFDEDISKIVKTLDQRKQQRSTAGLPERRTTVLCSATMKMNVQRLGEISLKDAVLIRSEENEHQAENGVHEDAASKSFLAPAQLQQSYTVVAAKLRLVTLVALLRRTFARKGSVMKAIVFVSCADSVEFHFSALTRLANKSNVEADHSSDEATEDKRAEVENDSIQPSPLLSSAANVLTLFKLHGSLPQPVRTSIVKAFTAATTPSLLIATDVASRGLDLPNLDLVIEYDPPFSAEDHLHRIGRTARLGRDGRAIIFLLPGAEEGYVDVLKSSYKSKIEGTKAITQMDVDDVLKKGFTSIGGGSAPKNRELKDWEREASEFQLDVERWVIDSQPGHEMAQKAFQSHVRAYATHVAAERKWFDIKALHLGHLAKAFGLRDPPGRMNVPGMGKRGAVTDSKRRRQSGERGTSKAESGARNETTAETEEAARKMKEKVRNKKMMMGAGADEFNIA